MAEVTPDNPKRFAPGMDAVSIIRQIVLLIGISGSIALGFWMVLWLQEPNYNVLYSSLDESEANAVLEALQQLNIEYKLDSKSGALLVPAKDVYDARIKLAAQGLPKSLAGGYGGLYGEEKNGFGVSETRERENLRQALEAELSRTIKSLNNVKSSRVHLALPKRSVFVRDAQKPRASVVVSLFPGRVLDEGQVSAIAHLVASSVPNLSIENVTIVDQSGRLLTAGERSSEIAMTSSQFEYARKVETSYIARIENILVPIVGNESVRAEVTADIDFTYNEQTQETFNPDNPALRNNEIVEEQSNGAVNGGIPGAVSNQPPGTTSVPEKAGTPESAGASATPTKSSKREMRNFELDKTISHTRTAMGRLRRISAAVIIDDRVATSENGQVVRTPRSPEEIERITGLVKKAIGFNLQRGDSVNVINESFTLPVEPAPVPGPPIWEQAWLWDVVKRVVGVILVVVVFFGVLKPLWNSLMRSVPVIAAVQNAPPAITNEVQEDVISLSGKEPQKKLEAPKTPYEQNMALAVQTVKDDPKLVAQVVKNWVNEDG